MDTRIEKQNGQDVLIITILIEPKTSGSGKSTVIATTGGNQATDLLWRGEKVTVGLNAYVPIK